MEERRWHRFYDFWVPRSLTYPQQPLSALMDFAANQYGDRTATIFYGAEMTYRDLRSHSIRLATALDALGIRPGDRVGLMLPNCPQFLIAFYAILRLGAVVVPLNPLYVERELRYVVEDSGMRAMIALDTMALKVMAVREQAGPEIVIFAGLQDYMPEAVRPLYLQRIQAQGMSIETPTGRGLYRWVDAMEKAGERFFQPPVNPMEDVAVLPYTGGTTGTPKGVMLTHFNLFANVIQAYVWVREFIRRGEERYLAALPLFHSFGMTSLMNVGMFTGSTLILLPRFDVEEALNTIRAYQPTFLPAVPTMYIALLNHPRAAESGLGSIRLCNSGAAPLPVEVIQQFARFSSGTFVEGYGLTEASPITHINPIMNLKKLGSIGLPIPDTDVRIVDVETGTRELEPGEIGELIIKGPQVMKGYWNRPEETAQTLRGGWLYTGDIARMDEDGYFYIVDRKKDMILTGGFNVYPREVEEVLYAHPAVLEATVVGVPDPYRGEAVKAYVVLKPGAQASEEEILAHCRKNLAPYKVPRSVEFRDSLPKSMVGKVLRRVLRETAPEIAAPSLKVPPDVPVRAFFIEWVPRLFDAAVAVTPPEGMEGTTLIIRYRVDQEVFTLRVEDGKRLTVVEGETGEIPHIELILDAEALREAITGRLYLGEPPYLAFRSRRRMEALQRLRGMVHLELERPDGTMWRAIAIYNGATEPSGILRMTTSDYSSMQRGELDGQVAFATGKLRWEGDFTLLIGLRALRE
ncbi:long-chain-fatty-acid--CoA ligase [Thermoflexus sp.]|uniref:long-chain-fatty-acid--CoA ligase n=1 Tax=Thermoflexus sp. TaxID=1969742 RepID=UPI002637D76B|nr:long-chain-fatty-acid--CoA ligase [Thermoflexus sp.]MCX7689192.1 long-chain-fatty-acid--CoA ligase [Thermoflexus sp.]